ncbi:MAG TPA: hypothetical protein VMT16_10190 [Thermoanaerobaculia bacterium]|nr:hypothetical protein [Thermoanaerobaculia bacterium]
MSQELRVRGVHRGGRLELADAAALPEGAEVEVVVRERLLAELEGMMRGNPFLDGSRPPPPPPLRW